MSYHWIEPARSHLRRRSFAGLGAQPEVHIVPRGITVDGSFRPTDELVLRAISESARRFGVSETDPSTFPGPETFDNIDPDVAGFQRIVDNPPSRAGKTPERLAAEAAASVYGACSALNLDPDWCAPFMAVGVKWLDRKRIFAGLKPRQATSIEVSQAVAAALQLSGPSKLGPTSYSRRLVGNTMLMPISYNEVTYSNRGQDIRNKPLFSEISTKFKTGWQRKPAQIPIKSVTIRRYPTDAVEDYRLALLMMGLVWTSSGYSSGSKRADGSTPVWPYTRTSTGHFNRFPIVHPPDADQTGPNRGLEVPYARFGYQDCADYYLEVLAMMRELGPDGVLVTSLFGWFEYMRFYGKARGWPEFEQQAQEAAANARSAALQSAAMAAGAIIALINPAAGAFVAVAGATLGATLGMLKNLFASDPYAPALPVLRWSQPVFTRDQLGAAMGQLVTLYETYRPAYEERLRRQVEAKAAPLREALTRFQAREFVRKATMVVTHPLALAALIALLGWVVYRGARARSKNPRRRRRRRRRS